MSILIRGAQQSDVISGLAMLMLTIRARHPPLTIARHRVRRKLEFFQVSVETYAEPSCPEQVSKILK